MLFSFDGPGASNPFVGVVADGAGNLYGTTTYGGRDKQGVAFELSPPAAGQSAWTETVLFSFHTTAGEPSQGSLILDRAGNLYGTTTYGGAAREGVVFELIPPGDGVSRWTEAVLQSFTGTNGEHLYGALIADGAGNLYGTAYDGGANDDGVVFELSPPLAGQTAWTETVLQSFDGADGKGPDAGLIADGAGDLYGTTRYGGSRGAGVVFKLTP